MGKVTIMTWNVWYHEKAGNLINLIKKIDPDILCAQELTVNFEANPGINIPKLIAQECGYQLHFEPMTIYGTSGEKTHMGNGIFSKHPIESRLIKYIQKADPAVKSYQTEDRSYAEAVIDIEGKKLTVGTVHMSYAKEFEMTEKKLAELDKLLEAVGKNHEQYILSGDMNALPGSVIVKKLEKLFVNAGPRASRSTWTTKPFSYQGFEANSLDWRLDYIFTTPDIKVKSSRIIKTGFSDHLPILVEVEI